MQSEKICRRNCQAARAVKPKRIVKFQLWKYRHYTNYALRDSSGVLGGIA